MRVRDKRKQQKAKASDKQKQADAESKPTTEGKATNASAAPTPPAAAAEAAAATVSATATTTETTTATTTTGATTRTTTTRATAQAAATAAVQQTPTLPATEKVAFDNRIKRKNVLALNEKVAALREYDRQPVYKHVGRMFNCSPDQIKRIVQQKDEILRAWEQRTRRSQDAKTQELKVVRVSMLGKAVYEWIRRMMYYKDFIISDGLIQKMALQFKSFMGLINFFPHQEWCDKFRSTYKIQHIDTKQLKIGYTQSYSVQINDIAKDVMSECARESDASAAIADDDEEENISANVSSSSHLDDDEADVDIDGGGDGSDADEEHQKDVKPSLSELNQRVHQPLPQLVRLPPVPPGTSQKVLLATPILPPGAPPGGAQTMTIIPLATLAQSITQRPTTPVKTPVKSTMPPPIVDIKKEIKTEPQDAEEQLPETTEKEPEEPPKVQEEPHKVQDTASSQPEDDELTAVRIKQELDSDGEYLDEDDDDDNGGRSSVTSLAEILAANVDDAKQYIEQTRASQRKRSRNLAPDPFTPMITLPPMPTLTKAPTPPAKRQRSQHLHDDNNNAGDGEAIINCAEARRYLKLLKEFATSKRNSRLIELTTRADEVMLELSDD